MTKEQRYPTISVGEVKRRFADVLGAVRYQGQRYVVERNGTPMAAIVPLEDLPAASEPVRERGFLALVGAFDDAPEYVDSLGKAVLKRPQQRSRPAAVLQS